MLISFLFYCNVNTDIILTCWYMDNIQIKLEKEND